MTELTRALEGKISESMRQAAESEQCKPSEVMEKIRAGIAVIPKNEARSFPARIIGQGFRTKVNANIGTSPSHHCLREEMGKLTAALSAGTDAVMDLSTGGRLHEILSEVLAQCPVPLGTVPVYGVAARLFDQEKNIADMSSDALFEEIEHQARLGVDFVTVHCGVTRRALEVVRETGRTMGMVSRGGSLMAEWMSLRKEENPLYAEYDRLLEICREYDVTLSLGDGLRPGAISDACDRAQVFELVTLGDLARRARAAGVQAMIEGPGHVPLSRIASDVKLQKRLCDGAPYYVLGPLPTDVAPGYDHLVGAVGGAIAAAAGVDFLCYVTPAEHLHLPTEEDVYEGVMASRIAAHIGDLEKGVTGAWEWDKAMSEARRRFDWNAMFSLAINPKLARERRGRTEDKERDVCTMCGDLCAIKTFDRVMNEDS